MGHFGPIFHSIPRVDSEKLGLNLFRVTRPPIPFPYDPVIRDTLRYIHFALVNSPNSHVVTVLATSGSARVGCIRLWKVSSGETIWQKDVNIPVKSVVNPRFSEDGRTLIACDKNVIETADVRSGHTIRIVKLNFRPTAVAISNQARCIALAHEKQDSSIGKRFANLEKLTDSNGRSMHIVSTTGIFNNQICYTASDHAIILAGHVALGTTKNVTTISWDTNSCRPLGHRVWGNVSADIRGPVHHISTNRGDGIVIRIEDRSSPRGVYEAADNLADYQLEHIYNLMTVSSRTEQMGNIYRELDAMAYNVVGNQVQCLADKRFLWTWNGELDEARLAGRLDVSQAPALESVLTFAGMETMENN